MAIVVILAILGLIFLRRLLIRFFIYLLANHAGRTTLGVLLCIGGLIFGLTSNIVAYQSLFQGSDVALTVHVNTPDDGNVYIETVDNLVAVYIIHDADFSPPVDVSMFQNSFGLNFNSLVYDSTNTQQMTEQFFGSFASGDTGYTVKQFSLNGTTFATADYQANPTGAFQNHWLAGGGIAGAGFLLLLISFGIPWLSKRWETAASAQSSSVGQSWPTSAFPGTPNMPTPQPGGIMPVNMSMPTQFTPQPGGIMPMPTQSRRNQVGSCPPMA